MKSRFIVLEGPDGGGTTRHATMLADRLRREGCDTVLTAEPTHGAVGTHIRSILRGDCLPSPDAVQLLFCADRAEHVASVIRPALDGGKTVVCDRYVLSTVVYGGIFGLDREWLLRVNERFPKPDLTIITLPPFAVCQERIGERSATDHFEREEIQRRIYASYRSVEHPATFFVDTSRGKEEVAEETHRQVREFFEATERVL